MEEKVNYTMVGVIVVLLTSILLSSALWLSIGFDKKRHSIYAVDMTEAASGLSEDSAVKFNGVKVGQVKKISLNHHDPRKVRLLLSIEVGTPITTSTTATLVAQGITGSTYVGLSASSANLTPLTRKHHEQYPIIPASASLFSQLDRVLKDVSQNIHDVSIGIKRIFDSTNAATLSKILTNIQTMTDVVVKNKKNIDDSLTNADKLLHHLSQSSEKLFQMMDDLHAGIQHIDHMATKVAAAGDNVTNAMKSGKITIEQFSRQTLPLVNGLLSKLNNISVNLEKVSTQLRQNPSIVIRGTAAATPGPGE